MNEDCLEGAERTVAVGNEGKDPVGLGWALRERVMEQIPAVTDALGLAVINPSDASLDQLHDAADKLMRALGRVLIEVERERRAPQRRR
jgi:hypothetical protein